MSTFNPDDRLNTYPLGKKLYTAVVKAKATWSDDIDHVEDLWRLSDWQAKANYQQVAEIFLEDMKGTSP